MTRPAAVLGRTAPRDGQGGPANTVTGASLTVRDVERLACAAGACEGLAVHATGGGAITLERVVARELPGVTDTCRGVALSVDADADLAVEPGSVHHAPEDPPAGWKLV